MPVTRIRGKSAVHSHGPLVIAQPPPAALDQHHHHHHQAISLNNHPLLKIESVVPTVGVHHNVRHSRMIRRSHSTVSSAYLRKVVDPRSRTVAVLNRCSGTAAAPAPGEQPIGDGYPDHEKTANVFPRIKRTKKDREKFPDRINLDRKGLTAIPLIDDEPQLRLLSLQHNLINEFHVPEIAENEEGDQPGGVDEVPLNGTTPKTLSPPRNGTETGQLLRQPLQFIPISASRSTIHRPIPSYISVRNRYGQPASGGLYYPGTGLSTMSNLSTSSTPSILINGIPNYCTRSLISGRTLQSLNINQKLILKKSPYVQTLYQAAVLGNNQSVNTPNGKSPSDSGISSTELTNGHGINTQELNTTQTLLQCRYGDTLHNLVFLDLYDNQIEKIGNLEGLKSLTVLLLGKNRIVDISGIVALRNSLRVLDLHGNRITNISNKICRLQELKSLNLAGNMLRQINNGDFSGLQNLRELNLKRNRVKKLNGFEDLQHLERLWLCNNDIHRVEDMSCIARAINLKEITVENNPVSLAGDCCSFLVSYLPNLLMLSQMHVTEQVKRAAMAWRKSKETTDVNYVSISSEVGQSIRREEVISNARTNWELLRSQPQFNSISIRPSNNSEKRNLDVVPTIDAKLLVTEKTISPKLEIKHSSTDSQESNDSIPREITPTSNGPPAGTPSSNDTDSLRLPLILEPQSHLETLIPIVRTENVSVEDSLGANVDSNSIFSGSSSTSSSRSPSSCRSSGPGSSTSELDDAKSDVEGANVEDRGRALAPDKHLSQQQDLEEEEDEGVRVEFKRRGKPKDLSRFPGNRLDDVKMPKIKMCDTEYAGEAKSNVSLSSSLRPEHSGTSAMEDSGITSTLRSVRNRCNTSRKLPPPTQSAQNLSVHRSQTAKISPSPSTSLVVVNNNNGNGKGAPLSNGSSGANNTNSTQALASVKTHVIDREREQGGDYLIEICGRYLNVYGVGALKFVDKQWNVQKAGDVHTVKFSYINFNNICGILGKIKGRFPNAENYCFRETNITCLGQLNSLAEIQGLQSIVIEPEGNLICTKKWRSYAIFRLAHWGLKQINGQDITEVETEEADRMYGQLPDLVLWSLPESLLAPLLSRLRLEEPCQASRLSAKEWLMQAEPSLKCVVGKEALQWRKSPTGNGNHLQQFDESIRGKGQQCFTQMMENACNAVEKLEKLETLWPTMLNDLIRNTIIDYSQLDTYVKNLQKSLPQ